MSKKSFALQQPPSDSDSDDEEQLSVVVSPITSASSVSASSVSASSASESTTTTKSSKTTKKFEDDDDDDDELEMMHLASKIRDDLKKDIKDLEKGITLYLEMIAEKKQRIKEKTASLKLWDKRVNTPTTFENASLSVNVKDNDRQLHNEVDGSLYYKSGGKKQFLKVSAVKVSTKSVRESGKPVLDGKEVKVHIKDKTATLEDLENADETELIEMHAEVSKKNKY
jgi:hypothetical protein